MPTIEDIIGGLRNEIRPLLETVMQAVLTKAQHVLEIAEQEVAEKRAEGLIEVAEEHAKRVAEDDTSRAALHREITAMQTHKEAQVGRVELNIGGQRFVTSVQTLRRITNTFFDAYFSGRYAQDVCVDGSIYVDRDGEYFSHVLEYMRDGHFSVMAPGARPSVALLCALKREFGFYSIELDAAEPVKLEQSEMALVMEGIGRLLVAGVGRHMSSMERFDAQTEQWVAAAALGTARAGFGACVLAGELCVTGGKGASGNRLSSVEKYSPSSDSWSVVAPMPESCTLHAAVTVGSSIYVLGSNLARTLKFDSAQGTWSQVLRMPEVRHACAACAVGTNIYV
jgi:hypothetical protein